MTRLVFVLALACIGMALPVHAQPPAPPHAAAPAAELAPNDYADEANWLCRPGRKGDVCDVDLTTTSVAADGTLTREAFTPNPKAPIDCFYVYPTVSTDPGVNSDMTPDPAEKNVILQQFARFASKCRTFAPMYRQMTLAGLRQRLGGALSFDNGVWYNDARDAFRSYLKRDNQGRGFVLVGHSQGAYILTEILRQEIDGKPAQKQLVGAYILGATFPVAKGKDVGGALKNIPLCRKPGQIGCVVNFSAFRSTVPPPANTLFGRATDAAMSGSCTNPATFGEGSATVQPYFLTAGRLIAMGGAPPVWASGKTVDTPFVTLPGLLTAACMTNEHATYLEITVKGDPADPRTDDIPGDLGLPGKPVPMWGLHLVDVNLVMGDLLKNVEAQAKAYSARR
jgi:pimeloyl-ACP methyl ester carboxylesterase